MMCADLALRLNVGHANSAVALDDKVVPSGNFTLIRMWALRWLMQYAPRSRKREEHPLSSIAVLWATGFL
jgi:hypothetical protein